MSTSSDLSHRLRFARFYLLGISTLVLLLLILFSWSLIRQRLVLGALSRANLQLDGERLTVEMERALWEAAEDCLRDAEIRGLAMPLGTETGPDRQAGMHSVLERAMSRHPIARHLFLLIEDRIVYPRMTGPRSLPSIPQSGTGDLPAEEIAAVRLQTIARAVENALAHVEVSEDRQRIRALYLKNAADGTQIFWLALSDPGQNRQVLALAVDQAWVAGPLLASCRESMKLDAGTYPVFQLASGAWTADAYVTVPFRTVFPDLALSLPAKGARESRTAALIEISLTVGSVLMMVGLLIMIYFLLTRVSRDMGALQVRSNLLGEVSHELKTPLTLISLYAETLRSDPDLSAEERRKCHQVISRECGRLNHLIENQLHFSRIERARASYQMTEGDLSRVIQRTVDMSGEWLTQQGFSLITELAPTLPPVRFDSERVAQVLINLIDNARKYSGSSRSIEIRTCQDQNNVIVEVRDFGIGIPPGEQTRIFDQFYRASNAGMETGTGLGLFVVTDIMRAHSGSIELESEVGVGSTFRLVFPAAWSGAGIV